MATTDYRYDPFQNILNAVNISGETHTIPSVSPFTIRLNEVPLKNNPSSIALTIDGKPASEVSSHPAAGEFWPDYSTGADNDETWNTGTILFNAADAGKTVVVSYKGTGNLVWARETSQAFIFQTPGTYTITAPPWATFALLSGCGGGGGGGGTAYGGVGGLGGHVINYYVPVTSDTTYTVIVGKGGDGGLYSNSSGVLPSSSGGITSFGNLLSLGGGGGGSSWNNTPGTTGSSPILAGYLEPVKGVIAGGGFFGTSGATGKPGTGHGSGGGGGSNYNSPGNPGTDGLLIVMWGR